MVCCTAAAVISAPALAVVPCDADLNLDTHINSADLNILLGAFGSGSAGDVDGNGTTNSQDLNVLLAHFGSSGCPGSCCEPNGTPQCADESCSELICPIDPFCCGIAWDGQCADQAAKVCGSCGGCCQATGAPGCNEAECQNAVCIFDDYCCNVAWDGLCADEAAVVCIACGGLNPADCCVAHGTPNCGNGDCMAEVCGADPFCCTTTWDELCAGNAAELCYVCGGDGPDPGACCFSNGSCVVTVTEFQCEVFGGIYNDDSNACSNGACASTADCCISHGSTGCNDASCEDLVCSIDPFCCNSSWDGQCTNEANEICGTCGGCCEASGVPGCGNEACQDAVCAVDPFCCNTEWDGICADRANDICAVCPGGSPPPPPPPAEGACCQPADEACFPATQAECNFMGGIYQGDNTQCLPGVCD